MAKSVGTAMKRKKIVFKDKFHSLSHLESHCFIRPFSILSLKGLLFIVTL